PSAIYSASRAKDCVRGFPEDFSATPPIAGCSRYACTGDETQEEKPAFGPRRGLGGPVQEGFSSHRLVPSALTYIEYIDVLPATKKRLRFRISTRGRLDLARTQARERDR